MLGDKIGEERGRVTGRRALKSGDPRHLKLEISFETQATLYGVPCVNIGTYQVFERIPGQLYGEGQGMLRTQDGEGAIWNGHGVGTPTPDGGVKFAASVAFQAGATGKLARLNNVLVLVEHTAGGDGSAKSTAGRVPGLISPTSRRLAGSSAARDTPPTAMTRRLGGHQAVWRGQEMAFSLPRFETCLALPTFRRSNVGLCSLNPISPRRWV